MKKNKEWLREQIERLSYTPKGLDENSSIISKNWVLNLIDQLDEPEVTLDKAFEKVAESYPMTKEEIWRHLERLVAHGGKVTYDEPEVLSQEWIDEHIDYADVGGDTSVYTCRRLKSLLVPKQDKPVIPQFVADLIEHYKRAGNSLGELLAHIEYEDVLKIKLKMLSEVVKWVYPDDFSDSEDRIDLIARAWLDGYEVEKEKLYHVVNKENYFMLRKYDGLVDTMQLSPTMSRDEFGKDTRFMLTEKEIKDYDKRYWAFAEEVTQ